MTRCPHLQTEARKRASVGEVKVQAQCTRCLRGVGGSIPLRAFPLQIQRLLSRWEEVKRPGKRKRAYRAYLASAEWKKLRAKILERDSHTCQLCGEEASEVDHTTYERFGNEREEDLRALCWNGHWSVTERQRAG